jgi:hypothetical protein
MTRYRLFAARDGDVIEETISAPDDEQARIIAAHRIVAGFGLDFLSERDFDEVIAETDGALLDVIPSEDAPETVSAWAKSQLSFMSHLEKKLEGRLNAEIAACESALLNLILAIDRASP